MGKRDPQPIHAIPRELEAKLVEAKRWCDACPPARIADERARQEWNAQGVLLLMDIVEAVENSWGYAAELPSGRHAKPVSG